MDRKEIDKIPGLKNLCDSGNVKIEVYNKLESRTLIFTFKKDNQAVVLNIPYDDVEFVNYETIIE